MITTRTHIFKQAQVNVVYLILLCLIVAGMGLYLHDYVAWQSPTFIISIIALPYAVYHNRRAHTSHRFLYLALALALVSFRLPDKTVSFFTLLTAAIGLCEAGFGKWRLLPLLIVAMLCPTTQYAANILSFPVRMWLTGISGTLLQLAGNHATVAGNVIVLNGANYAVDPECMGLKMLLTSLLSGLFLTAIIQQHLGKRLPAYMLCGSLCFVVACNIATNLCRILLLIYFNIAAGHIMHQLVGLACFVVYTIIPSALLLHFIIAKWGRKHETVMLQKAALNKRAALLVAIIFLSLFSSLILQTKTPPVAATPTAPKGYNLFKSSDGITTLTTAASLVHIKKITSCAHADHNPITCWTGSGYEFDHLQAVKRNATDIYMGTISKGNEVLYTAWWYDNGSERTISQWRWRMQMLKGAPAYAVVNITATSPGLLEAQVNSALAANVFKQIITR